MVAFINDLVRPIGRPPFSFPKRVLAGKIAGELGPAPLALASGLCQAIKMAKKRTKVDQLQRNVERLATRDEVEPSTTSTPTIEEPIRRRAHELYEARGREDGHELDDWLQAEAEITGNKRKAAAA